MSRLLCLLTTISLVVSSIAFPPNVAASNADDAADATYFYSVLESQGDHAELWRHIHPDSAAETPREVVVGWFADEWYPRGPQPSTILEVEFITWTWPVNGKTYPNTALVSYRQVLRDGGANTIDTDVVHLVKSGGEWKWFFGGTREFVDKQNRTYRSGPSSIPADDDIPEFGSRDESCQWFADNIAPTMPDLAFKVLSGCQKDRAGKWFWPTSGSDPRLVGGPILSTRQQNETAAERLRIQNTNRIIGSGLSVTVSSDYRFASLDDLIDNATRNACSLNLIALDSSSTQEYASLVSSYAVEDASGLYLGYLDWWFGIREVARELLLEYFTDELGLAYADASTLSYLLAPERLPFPFEMSSNYYIDLFLDFWVYS